MSGPGQRGAALVTAIFLIVVIAAVAAMIAQLAATQQVTSGRALDATRAYFAARARLEREIAVVATSVPGSSCPSEGPRPDIDGYQTALESCEEENISEGGDNYDVFILRVSAFRGDRTAGTLVRRELRALVTNGP